MGVALLRLCGALWAIYHFPVARPMYINLTIGINTCKNRKDLQEYCTQSTRRIEATDEGIVIVISKLAAEQVTNIYFHI